MPSRHPSGREWKDVAERRDVGGSIWHEKDIDTCEDCGHKIGLTDTEGQYSGHCTNCRKERGQTPYEAENWLMYHPNDPTTESQPSWGGRKVTDAELTKRDD